MAFVKNIYLSVHEVPTVVGNNFFKSFQIKRNCLFDECFVQFFFDVRVLFVKVFHDFLKEKYTALCFVKKKKNKKIHRLKLRQN